MTEGGIVYSHPEYAKKVYGNNVECRITFRAKHKDWRLMMRVEEIDIPDETYNKICNDALYIYDADTIVAKAVVSGHILCS